MNIGNIEQLTKRLIHATTKDENSGMAEISNEDAVQIVFVLSGVRNLMEYVEKIRMPKGK